MRISLQGRARKALLLGAAALFVVVYAGFALTEFLAAHFSEVATLPSLRRAVRLQPRNAEYQYRLGRYLSVVEPEPEEAAHAFRAAVALDSRQARYWFALAGAYQLLGNTAGQRDALEHAVAAEPTTPEVAWEAANFYLTQDDVDTALKHLRTVLTYDPYLPQSALPLCWRIRPDIDYLLREVVPPNASVDSTFLEFLLSKNETSAAGAVWAALVRLNQPLDRRYVFEYVRYLVANQQPDQARVVWEQAANLSNLSPYQPSAENLVVNGDFSLEILNGGFDWMYRESPDVSLALDPTQFHSGHDSLHLSFDSRGLEDAGIRQLVSVRPNTSYTVSSYYRAEDLQGAGGLRLVVQDLYTGKICFASEDLANSDFWKQVGGSFTANPETRLVVLRIQRQPAGSPIKGRLWIDNVRLAPVRGQGGSN